VQWALCSCYDNIGEYGLEAHGGVISFVTHHEEYFLREMGQMLKLQSEEAIRIHKKRLAQAEKRIGELDRFFLKIYEDTANSKLSDERFSMMSATYESEQTELKAEVKKLQEEIQVQEQQIQNLEVFIQRVKREEIYHPHGTHALRPQRACKGHLCGGSRQVQWQAKAEGTY